MGALLPDIPPIASISTIPSLLSSVLVEALFDDEVTLIVEQNHRFEWGVSKTLSVSFCRSFAQNPYVLHSKLPSKQPNWASSLVHLRLSSVRCSPQSVAKDSNDSTTAGAEV